MAAVAEIWHVSRDLKSPSGLSINRNDNGGTYADKLGYRGKAMLMSTAKLWPYLILLPYMTLAAPAWEAKPFNPPSYPLAVRSPYLSAWLKGGPDGGYLASWPFFQTESMTLGWVGYVRVNGTTYNFLGDPDANPSQKAVQRSATFTSTQSIFVLQAGPVNITATFLSPIEGDDLVRQSMPFSYLAISVTVSDGNTHRVQIYTDTSGEWLTDDPTSLMTWETTSTGSIGIHSATLATQIQSEIDDRASWGSSYHATLMNASSTFQTGADQSTRLQFINNGNLTNQSDGHFRPIGDSKPVFAFAHDLGNITTTGQTIVTAVGYDRSPAILYNSGQTTQHRQLFWRTSHTNTKDALSFFLQDYPRAKAAADIFDSKVYQDAAKISEDYASIVALSARQAYSGIEITAGPNLSGSLDPADVMVFLKGSSSGSHIQSVDIIYATFPIFIYTSPKIATGLLEPLLLREFNGANPLGYAIRDLGFYPNATGQTSHIAPVESSSNMIILALAAAHATRSNAQLSKYYDILDKYASYLVDEVPTFSTSQLSADDYNGPLKDQSNLAVKGTISLGAMNAIATRLGKGHATERWADAGRSFTEHWVTRAFSTDRSHITFTYNDDSSFALLYNIYADKLARTGLFQLTTTLKSAITKSTQYYPTVAKQYGVPIDSQTSWTRSDWSMFTAATVSDTQVRDLFITKLMAYLTSGTTTIPFADTFDVTTGQTKNTKPRPVVGGHFALLAMDEQLVTSVGVSQTSLARQVSPTGLSVMALVMILSISFI